MNERILELMTKAGFDVEKLRMYPGGWPREDLLVLQDFAELIVRECVAVLNRRFMGDMNREDMEVRRCIDDVKKHFGVKE